VRYGILCYVYDLNATRTRVETPLIDMEAYKVEYEGFDDTWICGWYMLPRFPRSEQIPFVASITAIRAAEDDAGDDIRSL
jgi:cephalosporin-C deacetylase-like acetyl esterase